MMKTNNFQGELTDIPAKREPLVTTITSLTNAQLIHPEGNPKIVPSYDTKSTLTGSKHPTNTPLWVDSILKNYSLNSVQDGTTNCCRK